MLKKRQGFLEIKILLKYFIPIMPGRTKPFNGRI